MPRTTSEVGLLSAVAHITLVLTITHLHLLPHSKPPPLMSQPSLLPCPCPLHPHTLTAHMSPRTPTSVGSCEGDRATGSAAWSVHADWVTAAPGKQLKLCWSYVSIGWSLAELSWPSSYKISFPPWLIWFSSTREQAGLEVTPPPRTQRSMVWDTLHLHLAWTFEASHCFHRKETIILLVILQHLSTIPLHPPRRMSTKFCNLSCNSSPGQQRPPLCLPGDSSTAQTWQRWQDPSRKPNKCHRSEPQGAVRCPSSSASWLWPPWAHGQQADASGHVLGEEDGVSVQNTDIIDRPLNRRSVIRL